MSGGGGGGGGWARAGQWRAAGDARGSESPLYEAVSPALYVVRAFGLAPYRYPPGNRPPRLRASGPYCLYSLLWASLYSWIVVTALMRFGGLDRDKPVLGVTENGKLVLNYVTALAELVLTVGRRRQFARVWNGIQDFDESFQLGRDGLGGRLLRLSRLWVWLSLVASAGVWTAINQLGMHAFDESYLQNVGYMLTYVGTYIATLKFVGMVFLLGQRFAYLNRLLAAQCLVRPAGLPPTQRNHALAKKVETWYNNLLSTSEMLSELYSWSLFLFLLNLFCHAVSNMYFFTIWTIIDPSYLKNLKVVLCLFTWLVVYLLQLLLLHVSCHFTSVEHFRSTLHYLNRRLKFTAAGCFDVNLPLLTTTFGHLTTYLVILLQIPDSS
ncbi:uncharacterized protein LOC131671187 isoform X2 [Phymastichus coffea]|uniref:uncharacterized protein LOC131671187 isoform X2 n=1 Tax=Phymastichus coffea TaxID=108790 RepID=UPI00273B5420|nr:uncharacterized protein LOC131671187 isoform X2 [Phymastichus coffea]